MISNPHHCQDFFFFLLTAGLIVLCVWLSQVCSITIHTVSQLVGWPSGLRRWFKAPVISMAWVRIPPLPLDFFIFFTHSSIDCVTQWRRQDFRKGGSRSIECAWKKMLVTTSTNYVGKEAMYELAVHAHINIFYICANTLVHLNISHTQPNISVNFDINKRRTIVRVYSYTCMTWPYASLVEKEDK